MNLKDAVFLAGYLTGTIITLAYGMWITKNAFWWYPFIKSKETERQEQHGH